jgi:hypothetical protein
MHFVHLEDNLVHLIKNRDTKSFRRPKSNKNYYEDSMFSKISKLNFLFEFKVFSVLLLNRNVIK